MLIDVTVKTLEAERSLGHCLHAFGFNLLFNVVQPRKGTQGPLIETNSVAGISPDESELASRRRCRLDRRPKREASDAYCCKDWWAAELTPVTCYRHFRRDASIDMAPNFGDRRQSWQAENT